MKLAQLPFSASFTLPSPSTLYRVQRTRMRAGSVSFGRYLHVPPPGLMVGRYDLKVDTVGYFAAEAETAAYETMVRRATAMVSCSALALRSLITLQTAATLNLLDLRPHAHDWPFTQSPRYAPTWQLAEDAHRAGFDGIAYYSAQQHGAECYAIFGPAMKHLTGIARVPLVHAGGALHAVCARTIMGGQVGLVP